MKSYYLTKKVELSWWRLLPRAALVACALLSWLRAESLSLVHPAPSRHAFLSPRDTGTALYMAASDDIGKETSPVVVAVTLKMAFDTAWGVADSSEQKSERFTSSASLDLVHRLRRCSHAVLVGRGTVERDDCTLTVRRVPLLAEQPVRVVVDPKLTLFQDEKSYQLFHDGLATIVYCTKDNLKDDDLVSSNENVTIVGLTPNDNGYLSPGDILNDLQKRGIHHIMVEGGPATTKHWLQEKLVDRAILIRAPVTFREPVPSGMTLDMIKEAGLQLLGTSPSDGDTVEYWSRPTEPWPTSELTEWP